MSREQRDVLAAHGVKIERERQGKGSHVVLYCVGPQGQRFIVVESLQRSPDWHAIRRFKTILKRKLGDVK